MRSSIRFRTFAVSAVTLSILAAVPVVAQTPSLGSVARKEQERRKTVGPPTKVLTNDDLPRVTSPAMPPPVPEAAPVEQAVTPAQPPAPPEPEKDEAYWRARIGEPRELLRRDEVLLPALQSRVNALTSDFSGRDDPYQRAQIGEERLKAIAELDRVQAEIAQLKQKIEDIEEEARRAGVPPGWLR